MDRRARRDLWLMSAPFLVGVALLVVAPAAVTVWSSFTDWDLLTAPRWVGLANHRELLHDDIFRVALGNSLRHVAVAVPIGFVLAVALALLLSRGGRGVRAARWSVLAPSVLPEIALGLVWLWILNPIAGPLNQALEAVGLPTPAWLTEPTAARWAIVLIGAFGIGAGFLIAFASIRSIPQELFDLAAEQGAGPASRFVRVTLPLAAPGLLLVAALGVVTSAQATYVPALIVTEGGPPPYATTSLPLFAHRTAFEYLRYGYASAATTWTIAVTASILWLMLRVVARWRGSLVIR